MSLDRAFEKRLAGVINARARGVLQGGLKGVERESLRVTPAGRISIAPHPRALGSASGISWTLSLWTLPRSVKIIR